jgi:hypothetical protein
LKTGIHVNTAKWCFSFPHFYFLKKSYVNDAFTY